MKPAVTDADGQMLQRPQRATYPASSLKDVQADWLETLFVRVRPRRA